MKTFKMVFSLGSVYYWVNDLEFQDYHSIHKHTTSSPNKYSSNTELFAL